MAPYERKLGFILIILHFWLLEEISSTVIPRAKITIRNATIFDLQAIGKIAIDVSIHSAETVYRYPYIDQYPDDYNKCKLEETKTLLKNGLYPTKDLHTMVAEIEDDTGEKKIIAHATWDIIALKEGKHLTQEADYLETKLLTSSTVTKGDHCDRRRDADWKRIEHYDNVILPAMWKYLEPTHRTSFPRSYIHLERVATAPEWQGHGAGTMLCTWGVNLAQDHDLPIGLFSTAAGYHMYTELGFKEMAKIHVQVAGEEDSVSMPAMKWFPKAESESPTQGQNTIAKLGSVLQKFLGGRRG